MMKKKMMMEIMMEMPMKVETSREVSGSSGVIEAPFQFGSRDSTTATSYLFFVVVF